MPDTSQPSWLAQGAFQNHVTESESRPHRPTHATELLEASPSHMPNRVIVRMNYSHIINYKALYRQILRIKQIRYTQKDSAMLGNFAFSQFNITK